MNWFNVSIGGLQKPAFTSATVAELGTWLRLGCYCAEQENGGHILNCKEWTDRQWLIAAGLERNDVQAPSQLWRWDKVGGLYVNHYPEDQEREVKLKRKAGKDTAKRRWANKMNSAVPRVKDSSATSSATSSANAKGKCNGREYTINGDRCPELDPEPE